jgi:hypothetical protein
MRFPIPRVLKISADHGRGIWLMRDAMDEVSFECGGTEVHMRKASHVFQEEFQQFDRYR